MKLKLFIWLALLLPFTANAQWVNGVIQRNASSTFIQYLQGANAVRLATYADIPTVTPVSFTAFGSTPNANGASVTSNVITLQPADATHDGGLTASTQQIGGDKEFLNAIKFLGVAGESYINIPFPVSGGIPVIPIAPLNSINITGGNSAIGFKNDQNIYASISSSSLTADRAYTLPDATGTLALLSSPAFTGTPTAPTATAGTNTTQLATTAFVTTAVGAVTSPMTRTGTIVSPTTANDNIRVTTNNGLPAIEGNGSGSSGGVSGNSSGGFAGVSGENTGTGSAGGFRNTNATNPTVSAQNLNASGPIYRGINSASSTVFTVANTGSASSTPQGTFYGTATGSITSAQLATSLTDETGSGSAVFATSPTLVTPNIGVATGTSLSTSGNIGTTAGNVTIGNGMDVSWPLGLIRYTSGTGMNFATNGSGRMLISDAGAMRWSAYTAGTLASDASGNITSVSSRLVKERFKPFTRGLEAIKGLTPEKWHYRKSSGLDTTHEYTSLIAENVKEFIPEAVFDVQEGQNLAVQDRPIIATMINAINQLREIVEKQDARILYLEKQLNK